MEIGNISLGGVKSSGGVTRKRGWTHVLQCFAVMVASGVCFPWFQGLERRDGERARTDTSGDDDDDAWRSKGGGRELPLLGALGKGQHELTKGNSFSKL